MRAVPLRECYPLLHSLAYSIARAARVRMPRIYAYGRDRSAYIPGYGIFMPRYDTAFFEASLLHEMAHHIQFSRVGARGRKRILRRPHAHGYVEALRYVLTAWFGERDRWDYPFDWEYRSVAKALRNG